MSKNGRPSGAKQKRVRTFKGGVKLSVHHEGGKAHGALVEHDGCRWVLPQWPTRIRTAWPVDGGVAVEFKNGSSTLLEASKATQLQEQAGAPLPGRAGGSMGGFDPRAHGKIRYIVRAFGKWAQGKQHICVRRLLTEHPEIVKTPARANALCAWLKDQWAGTTKWRGPRSNPAQKAEEEAIRAQAQATAYARFTHGMPQITPKQLDALVEDVRSLTDESVEGVLEELGIEGGASDPYVALAEHDAQLSSLALSEVEAEIKTALRKRQSVELHGLIREWFSLHGDPREVQKNYEELTEAAKRITTGTGPLTPASSIDRRVLEAKQRDLPKEYDSEEESVDEPEQAYSSTRTESVENIEEATLTAAVRNKLPSSAFVFPGERAYPIHDRSHAINALARASGKSVEGAVRSAVCKRYPDLPACQQGRQKLPSQQEAESTFRTVKEGKVIDELGDGELDGAVALYQGEFIEDLRERAVSLYREAGGDDSGERTRIEAANRADLSRIVAFLEQNGESKYGEPPNLRRGRISESGGTNCGHCFYFGEGNCTMFSYPVSEGEVCDEYEPEL